jgi:hypothetical protein
MRLDQTNPRRRFRRNKKKNPSNRPNGSIQTFHDPSFLVMAVLAPNCINQDAGILPHLCTGGETAAQRPCIELIHTYVRTVLVIAHTYTRTYAIR